MPTARNASYQSPSGQLAVYMGSLRPPSWSSIITANSTLFEIPNTSLKSLVTPLMPVGSYIGSDPATEFANAFACAALSQDGDTGTWAGVGGHTNTSQNGVFRRNYTTMTLERLQIPTPTDKYPPQFISGGNQPGPLVYPSGFSVGRFALQSELTAPADAGWGAPFQAPAARHMYQSAAVDKNGRVQAFYLKHSIFNTNTGLWEKCGFDDFGPKLAAAFPNYQSAPLGPDTVTVYDPVTHRFLVTLVPGDEGLSWRHGFVMVDADTGNIVYNKQGDPFSPCAAVRVGRWVYGFSSADATKGWRYNLDMDPNAAGAIEWLQFQGDTFTQPPLSTTFEQIPTCYHPTRGTILRWDYVNNRTAFYEVALTAVGGAGTQASPYLLQQTRRALAGTPPPTVILNYQMHYHPPSQAILLEPAAQSNMYAVRM